MDLSNINEDELLDELRRRNAMMFFVACKTHTLQNDDAVSTAAKAKDITQLGRLIQYSCEHLAAKTKAKQSVIIPSGTIITGGN